MQNDNLKKLNEVLREIETERYQPHLREGSLWAMVARV